MATIKKKDLIERIAAQTKQRRATVKESLQTFLDLVVEELRKGNRIEFRDFGVFEPKDRAARMAQNPKTLERVPVPARRAVKFKVGRRVQRILDEAVQQNGNHAAVEGDHNHLAVTVPRRPKPAASATPNQTDET